MQLCGTEELVPGQDVEKKKLKNLPGSRSVFSALAERWRFLESFFKNTDNLGPNCRDSGLIGLGIRNLKNFPGDSTTQPSLRITSPAVGEKNKVILLTLGS